MGNVRELVQLGTGEWGMLESWYKFFLPRDKYFGNLLVACLLVHCFNNSTSKLPTPQYNGSL